MDLVIPDKNKTLEGGAVDPWTKPKYRSWLGNFRKTARSKSVRLTVPFCDLTEKEQEPSSPPSATSSISSKPRNISCTCASS
jgi:excinuclease UvrABC ATPase subunit